MSDYGWNNFGSSDEKSANSQIWKTMINMPNGDVIDSSLLENVIKKDVTYVYNENTMEIEEKIELLIVQKAGVKFLSYFFPSIDERDKFVEDFKEKLIIKGIEIL